MIEIGDLVRSKTYNKYGIVWSKVAHSDLWNVRTGIHETMDLLVLDSEDLEVLKEIPRNILAVEDGSVDIDKLEKDGFYVIPYRQGAKPPILLKSNNE